MIYLSLFFTFLKIGAFTFGGGYAMLPLIQEEVSRHGWLDMQSLVDFVAVAESTPGPFAINISTYVGMETAGVPGAFFATFGVVLPSFVIILIVARIYIAFCRNHVVKGVMETLKPAVIGLIASAVISVGVSVFFSGGLTAQVFKTSAFWFSFVVFAVMFVMSIRKVHPIIVVVLSALCGIAAGYLGII